MNGADAKSRVNLTELPDFLDIHDVAALLPLSRSSIYRGAKNGEIPHVRMGRRLMFRKDEIDRWFRDRSAESVGDSEIRE